MSRTNKSRNKSAIAGSPEISPRGKPVMNGYDDVQGPGSRKKAKQEANSKRRQQSKKAVQDT